MSEQSEKPYRPEFAILNGEVLPFAEARISIMAPGLTFAATVFEGLRAYWVEEEGQLHIFRLPEHLERLQFSMRVVEILPPPTNSELESQIIEVLRANEMREDCYIRVQTFVDDWGEMIATGPVGTSVICRRRPRIPAFETGKHFVVSSWRRNADDASPPRLKATANYLNSRLAGLEANRVGAGGAIILNRDGSVSEGPGGCIFIVRDGRLITPPVTAGILESITRGTLLLLADDLGLEASERDVGRTELYLAEEAFYCGTGQEITPILSVDQKPLGDGQPGPITRRLQAAYDGVVRGRDDRYRHWLTQTYD
ncbi:MAG: branched-chain-amino-acid transaminase [Alphaproteobacteria bacterium]|jgi:branched-chain amino acid aminotransferase|nr:branched-chain-amino-acid transaminase [Alphaproteobacteria bacterium]MDP6815485.1 branched-chain-amino-acid transaminase [Alphaproteobacteria bacterium]